MAPENIAYDITFDPKVLLRLEPNASSESFRERYAALACAVLYPEMKYEDYLAKAGSFSGKKGLIDEINGATSAEEIRDILKEKLTQEKSDAGKPIVKVNRKKYRALNVALIVAIVLFVLSSGLALKFVISDIPALKEETSMSNAFIRAEYPGVIKEAKAIGDSKLTTEERYMAAYASVKTAALSSQQKDEVISTLKPTSDKMLLDYWIYMGLLDYDKSLDLAKRIGKSDLEIYALLIMKEDVTNDRALSGADKEAKLKSIDEQLSTLDESIG
jgi:type VII secretion protein EssB